MTAMDELRYGRLSWNYGDVGTLHVLELDQGVKLGAEFKDEQAMYRQRTASLQGYRVK